MFILAWIMCLLKFLYDLGNMTCLSAAIWNHTATLSPPSVVSRMSGISEAEDAYNKVYARKPVQISTYLMSALIETASQLSHELPSSERARIMTAVINNHLITGIREVDIFNARSVLEIEEIVGVDTEAMFKTLIRTAVVDRRVSCCACPSVVSCCSCGKSNLKAVELRPLSGAWFYSKDGPCNCIG